MIKRRANRLCVALAAMIFLSVSIYAHQAKYYMYIPDKRNVPIAVSVPTIWGFRLVLKSDNNPDFAQALNHYNVKEFKQFFPDALTDWLRDVYLIECDSTYREGGELLLNKDKNVKYAMPFDRMITLRFKHIVPLVVKLGIPRTPEDPMEIGDYYSPLLNKINRWNVLEERPEEGKWTYIYKLDGDTIIDGRKYRTLYCTVDKQAKKWRKRGYLYEDIFRKKVWFRPMEGHRDGLIYDFDVAEGDTVYTMSKFTPDYKEAHDSIRHIVKKTDTLRINNKDYRRIIVESAYIGLSGISQYSFENEWVEGIGSMKGLLSLYVMLPGSFSETLLAFYQDDKLVYKSPKHNEVFIWETVGNEFIEDNTQIFVSPDGRMLHIGSVGTFCSVSVYSMQGTEVFRQTATPYTTTLALPQLPAGIYVATVRLGGKYIAKKIIINRI